MLPDGEADPDAGRAKLACEPPVEFLEFASDGGGAGGQAFMKEDEGWEEGNVQVVDVGKTSG